MAGGELLKRPELHAGSPVIKKVKKKNGVIISGASD
jgi:hypothetical protein